MYHFDNLSLKPNPSDFDEVAIGLMKDFFNGISTDLLFPGKRKSLIDKLLSWKKDVMLASTTFQIMELRRKKQSTEAEQFLLLKLSQKVISHDPPRDDEFLINIIKNVPSRRVGAGPQEEALIIVGKVIGRADSSKRARDYLNKLIKHKIPPENLREDFCDLFGLTCSSNYYNCISDFTIFRHIIENIFEYTLEESTFDNLYRDMDQSRLKKNMAEDNSRFINGVYHEPPNVKHSLLDMSSYEWALHDIETRKLKNK